MEQPPRQSGRPDAAGPRSPRDGSRADRHGRVYGGGSGSLEIDGRADAFGTRAEAVAMFDECLRRALERAGGAVV